MNPLSKFCLHHANDIRQIGILLIALICMGAALGFERSLLPRMAVEVWQIHSSTTVLNLVASFGASKAVANVLAGPLADRFGRKPTLILGFVVGLPVMPFVNYARHWGSVTTMNVAFGVSQGLLGSALFFLLIDVMGPQRRGIAVGIGECTIYVTTAAVNVFGVDLASQFGYRPVPFWVATIFAVGGLLSTIPLQDTLAQVQAEQNQQVTQITRSLRLAEEINDLVSVKSLRSVLSSQQNLRDLHSAIVSPGQERPKKVPKASANKRLLVPPITRRQSKAPNPQPLTPTTTATTTTTSTHDDEEDPKPIESSKPPVQKSPYPVDSTKSIESTSVYYNVYPDDSDSSINSEDEDNNDDDDHPHEFQYWDETLRKTIQQMEMRIPTRILPWRNTCQPDRHQPQDTQQQQELEASETTPLFFHDLKEGDADPEADYYEAVSFSDSDLEDSVDDDQEYEALPSQQGHHHHQALDQLEHDIKTMYPTAFSKATNVFFNNPNYCILCLSGMAMNFKDGFAWGSFPLFFSNFHHLTDEHTALLVAVYPLCWGIAQAFTGALSDLYGRRLFLLSGFGSCAIGTALFFVPGFVWGRPADDNPLHLGVWVVADVFLGLGTALAYPALQAAVADEILPLYRGLGLGFYRFVRDMGYVVGALVCGSLTDALGYPATFLIVAGVLGAAFLSLYTFYIPLKLR